MESAQFFVCAMVLVCAAITQVKAGDCPPEIVAAVKAVQAVCISEEMSQKNLEDITLQEINTIQECYVRESQNHGVLVNKFASCGDETDNAKKLTCVQRELAKENCTPENLSKK